MRIKKILLHELCVPLKHPYILSKEYGIQHHTTPIIAEIHTDCSLVGYGECDPWPLFTGDSQESAMVVLARHLCPQLIGKDPTNIHDIHQVMDATIRGNHISKSAIDMASYDLFGKSVGVPVHQLLGGKRRNKIRCFWSVGGATPESTAEEVLSIKKQGYYGCMIKIGTENYRNDIARTLAAREAAGPDFPLVADANQGWDVETAIAYGRACERADLLYFEQPVQSWDIKGLSRIRRKINIPISADEGVATLQDAVALVADQSDKAWRYPASQTDLRLRRRVRNKAFLQFHDRRRDHTVCQPRGSGYRSKPYDDNRSLFFLPPPLGKRYMRFPFPRNRWHYTHYGYPRFRYHNRSRCFKKIYRRYLLH